MLELRPNCELCDRDLPPAAVDARICTFECTFCAACVEKHLFNVCPNCGGGFEKRPVRPAMTHRPGVSLENQPASEQRRHTRFSVAEIEAFVSGVKNIPPEKR